MLIGPPTHGYSIRICPIGASGSALLELQAPMMTDPWCAKGFSAYPENQVSLSRPFSRREDLGIPFSSDPELATKADMGVILIIPLCSRAVVRKYRLNLDKLRRSHTVAGEHCGAMGGRGDRRGRWAPGGARGWGRILSLHCRVLAGSFRILNSNVNIIKVYLQGG